MKGRERKNICATHDHESGREREIRRSESDPRKSEREAAIG